ncbi:hypothetical protein [Streptomyces virginiae]|uniref:hypothetical protein n=3 Tax=Actinomycetes TaxID=1760 RepID=UPI0012FE8C86|nr:hypothetical protein [Streptomyces virginiae]
MGIRLIVEVLDYAPADLTWRERCALLVLAENANDSTRQCWPGIEDDPEIAHRMRLPGRSSRYDVMSALRKKKALETVSAGRRGHRAVYKVAEMGPTLGPETQDPNGETGSGNSGHRVPDPRTQTEGKGPENPDPNPEKGSGNHVVRVREPREQGPETQDPFPSDPSTPSTDKDSSPAAVSRPAPRAGAKTGQQKDHHLAAFGAFWHNYPLKRAREEAKKAWIAAIERGADPQRMVDGAQAYARERRDQDPQYTKHPATWLNKGCYDDEPAGQPNLRVVDGQKYQPFRLDPNANYANGF